MLSALIAEELSLLLFVVLGCLPFLLGPRGDYDREADEFIARYIEQQKRPPSKNKRPFQRRREKPSGRVQRV
jgi:hypothetical protein